MKSIAPLLALVVACGGGTSAGPDGGADAAPPAGDPVTVHYAYFAVGSAKDLVQVGAPVLFYDADGHVVERAVTDASGVARGHVTPGGAVTAVPATGTAPADQALFTWIDVAPGATLYTTSPVHVPTTETLPITLPLDGDASLYWAWGPGLFGQSMTVPATGPITFDTVQSLPAPATGTVIAESVHPSAPHRFVVSTGVAFPAAAIDLSSATWIDPTPLDLVLSDLPQPFATASWRYTRYDGAIALWDGTAVVSNPGASTTVHYDTPGALGDGAAISTYMQLGDPRRYVAAAIDAPAATTDVGAMIPPRLDALALSADGALTWTRDGAGPASLAIVLDLAAAPGGPSWSIVAPGDRTSLALPTLPSDLTPPALTRFVGRFVGGNDPGGYRAYATDPQAFDPYAWAAQRPAAGTYRISEE